MLLGSSGSIGRSAISLVRHYPGLFRIESLAVNRNIKALGQQAEEFGPGRVFIGGDINKDKIKQSFPDTDVFSGERDLEEFIAGSTADIAISSISGFAGLMPTYYCIKNNIPKIGLANKESLVCAGRILMESAAENSITVIPVDSEHSTLFKLLSGHKPSDIKKIVLTASGGPFLKMSRKELKEVTVSQALNHPRWKMGRKISIDSATMVNKVLEVIEAHYLFGMPFEKIDIVIHPQSIVHSFIKTKSNTYIAELGPADMRIPIGNALFYPRDFENSIIEFDIWDAEPLVFEKPSPERFPILSYPSYVMDSANKQACNIAFNASNEEAVDAFLNGLIPFVRIEDVIFSTLDTAGEKDPASIEEVLEYDILFRQRAKKIIQGICKK